METRRTKGARSIAAYPLFALCGASMILVGSAARVTAQSPEPVAASLSSDSVEMAEVFELRVEIHVPPRSAVWVPDTLPASEELESLAPVEWRARRGPDGGATLTLAYPLIPFASSMVAVPALEVLVAPMLETDEGERLPGGSVLAPWEARRRGSSVRRLAVEPPYVWVEPVHTAEQVLGGVSPRPPADVVGPGWSWPALGLLLLFTSVIGAAAAHTARTLLAERPALAEGPAEALTPEQARLRATAELDRLIGEGPHGPERALALYTASSRAVRDYVAHIQPGWSLALTSSELTEQLAGGGRAGRSLVEEMARAERVKFGRLRPDPAVTDAHLSTLRAWLVDALEGGA